MGCESLRDAVTGAPVKVDSDGNLSAKTKPAQWIASTNHGDNVNDSPTEFVPATPGRVYIRFTNNGANTVFIFPSGTVSTDDTKLAPGASIEFSGGYEGAWWGITASTTERVSVVEFYVT